jgi:hypothetical protein
MSGEHVFLSYCSDDKRFAEELVRDLESDGIRIWYAPRNVRPGIDYSEQIQAAIESAGAFVIIISEASNQSDFVRAETEMAFSRRRPIFPLRIAPVAPAAGLALFLQLRHWTDAFGPRRQTATARLGEELRGLTLSRGPRRGNKTLFRRDRPRGAGGRTLSGRRSRAALLLIATGSGALMLFLFLLLQTNSQSRAQMRDGPPGSAGGNAEASASPPNTGVPNYEPVVESWARYIMETAPPPPDENLAMDNVATAAPAPGAPSNAAEPAKDINGM